MGLYDRDYTQEQFGGKFQQSSWKRMPRMSAGGFWWFTPIVKRLMIANSVIFLLLLSSEPLRDFLYDWFSAYWSIGGMLLQPWRVITYQFLHASVTPDGRIVFGHLFGNMIGLFFFGRILEKHWGSKKFLIFYLTCGAAGGLAYPILTSIGFLDKSYLIGASGSVFGILAAVAILFPRVLVYIWGIFPIPMWVLSVAYLLFSIRGLFGGSNVGGEAAHLAGMAAGAIYVLSQSWRAKLKTKINIGAWERKMTTQRDLQKEVDRILEKIHQKGIQSLSYKEKKILRQATETEQRQNRT